MECKVCELIKEGGESVHAISHARAVRTAHVLAIKESVNTTFTFVEAYTVYFRRIYEHEYKRNKKVEQERLSRRCYKRARKEYPDQICDYCGEFSDAFKEAVHAEVETIYARSKYPNPLNPPYHNKRLDRIRPY